MLAGEIGAVLSEAVEAGGSTLRDFTHADGGQGAFQERFFVYDREGEPCGTCGTPIERIVQQGRSTYFCPACQPRAKAKRR
jgi:formamidopyrimidine-DNA glycosylase